MCFPLQTVPAGVQPPAPLREAGRGLEPLPGGCGAAGGGAGAGLAQQAAGGRLSLGLLGPGQHSH